MYYDCVKLRSHNCSNIRGELKFNSPLIFRMFKGLNIVVEMELVRMGTECDCVHFIFLLVVYPGLDKVLGKDTTLEQIVMIFLQSIQYLAERAGGGSDLGFLFRFEFLNIFINRGSRINLVLNSIQSRQQHCREGEIRIAA